MDKTLSLFKLMRPKQWIKNFFVFGAIIFSQNILNTNLIYRNFLTFIAFCFVSSSVYVLNDIVDKEKDKAHPKKCTRPIASGKVKIPEAMFLGLLLLSLSLYIMHGIDIKLDYIVLIYLLNNILYSFWIKNIVLLDVFSIAIGFILRVIAGSLATNVTSSNWILLCTLFLSLFLGFGKRRGEILLLKDGANNHRKILNEYTIEMLGQSINLSLTCTIVFYAIYTAIGSSNPNMVWTTIFVVYGILRYNYLMFSKNEGGSPTELVTKDIHLLIDIILWVICCVLILIK